MKTVKYCPKCKSLVKWTYCVAYADKHDTIEIEDTRWEPVICRDSYWYFVWTLGWKTWETLPSRYGKWEPELINYI